MKYENSCMCVYFINIDIFIDDVELIILSQTNEKYEIFHYLI